jgi:hypothetical protein
MVASIASVGSTVAFASNIDNGKKIELEHDIASTKMV